MPHPSSRSAFEHSTCKNYGKVQGSHYCHAKLNHQRLAFGITAGCTKFKQNYTTLTLFCLDFLRVARLGGGGGGEVPVAYNSKTINDNEMKFGWSSKGSSAD